jgi:sec-independent protein translocase protein TatC
MIKYIIEIKNRVLLTTLSYSFLFITAYSYKEVLLFLIVKPIYLFKNNFFNNDYFIFTDVTEVFFLYLKVAFFFSFQISLTFIFYHAFVFLSYALFKKEYDLVKLLIKVSLFVWFLSALISTSVVIPLTWNFFLTFQDLMIETNTISLHFEAKIVEYFNFYTSFYFICGLYSQLVAIIFFFFHYYTIGFKTIRKFRKLYYFSFLIFATLLTPDVPSQSLVIILLLIIYETFIIIFLIIKKKQILIFNKATN